MAQHYDLSLDRREVALAVASRALRVARGLATARPGNVYIPNKDEDGNPDGTGTWIGSGGVGNGGVSQWIGDTTAPGRPTGCSCSSAWGVVYCRWDGTLEGGVPADFAHVSVSVGGAEAGRMAEAGVLALDGHEDGEELDVSFVAYDAARDREGNLAPNASEATVVHVTVSDERAEIDADVSQAREDAAAALEQAQQTATAAAAGVQEAKDAAQAAKDAADEAKATADGYQQQISDVTVKVDGVERSVTELSAEVSGAVEDAAGALSAATKAQQDIDGFRQTAEQTYQPKGDYATSTDLQSYATKSEVQQTASELSQSVEAATETAEGALTQASQAKQTADEVSQTLTTDYVSKTDASKTYASKAELSATSSSLSARVEEAASTADAAQRKALEVEATASGLSTTISEVSTVASQAKSAASAAQADADAAQSTADGAVTKVTQLEATVDGVSSRVSTAQQTADSAVEAASAAQQSVDGFKTTVSQTYATKTSVSAVEDKADAAQSAANSAASAASTAQSTANTAKSNAATAQDAADAAQADLDAYKGTVSSTYATKSSVTQTANSIKSEVAATYATQKDVDGISVGGTNLLRNSAFDNGTASWTNEGVPTFAVVSDSTYGKALHFKPTSTYPDQRIYQNVNTTVKPSTTYTLTFMAKATAAASLYSAVAGSNLSTAHAVKTAWARFQRTFTTSSSQSGSLTFYGVGDFYITNVKLEKGNKPTDWSPAPEDMLSAADASATYATKTALTQTEDSITAEVAKTYQTKDGMSSYATKSYVDQQDTSIKSTVQSVKTTADSALTKASTVEQTAEGLEVTLTETTSTANSALSKANSAASAASTAQSTANTAKTNASTALSTANSAKTTATNAQNTANTAKSTADGMKGTVMVENGSFESNSTAGWTFNGTSSPYVNSTVPYSGTYKLVCPYSASGNTNIVNNTSFPVRDGQKFRVTVAAFPDTTLSSASIGLIFNDNVTATSGVAFTGGAWHVYTAVITVPSGKTSARARIAWNHTASGVMRIDSVTVEDVTDAQAAQTAATAAAKTATNYLKFDSSGLCVGNQTSGALGMNALVAASKIAMRNGTTELMSIEPALIDLGKNSKSARVRMCGGTVDISANDEGYGPYGVISGTNGVAMMHETGLGGVQVSVDPDGAILAYGTNYFQLTNTRANLGARDLLLASQVLWSGAYWPNRSQTCSLSRPVHECQEGIVLHFQAYSGGALNQDHNYVFVPRSHVTSFGGAGVGVLLCDGTRFGRKYVYVYDTYVTGIDANGTTGTCAGVAMTNNRWALTEVLGA